MYGDSGYDRYLEFQYQHSGDFHEALFRAIALADDQNLARLEKGFPQEVHAHMAWTQFGVAPFVAGVTAGHPLLKQVLDEHGADLAVRLALSQKMTPP